MNSNTKKIKSYISILMASTLLAGCTLPGTVTNAQYKINNSDVPEVQNDTKQAYQPAPALNVNRVQLDNKPFTTNVAQMSLNGVPLPFEYESNPNFGFTEAQPLTLEQIGALISSKTNIPINFNSDITAGTAAQPVSSASPSNINGVLSSMGISGSINAPEQDSANMMSIQYQGTLSQFLNQVAAHFNVSWSYDGYQIKFFKNLTKTFYIDVLPGSIDAKSDASGGSSTSGGGGGTSTGATTTNSSSQDLSSTLSISLWKDLDSSLSKIVGKDGTYASAMSAGTVTVTAPPDIVQKVADYINFENKRLSQQVTVSVQVLNVTLNRADTDTVNLKGLFSGLKGYQISFGNAVSTALSATAPGLAASIASPTSPFSTTSALLSALSTNDRVSVKTTTSITTLNGVPAPVDITNTQGYVSSVSTTLGVGNTTGSSSGTQTTLNTSTLTTGYQLNLLPRIMNNGQDVMLGYGINISQNVGPNAGFTSFTSGGQTVQLPDINSNIFVQQSMVPNGSTLILSGFEQNNNVANLNGQGTPGFLGLGGSQNGQLNKELLVILITPVVINTDASAKTGTQGIQ